MHALATMPMQPRSQISRFGRTKYICMRARFLFLLHFQNTYFWAQNIWVALPSNAPLRQWAGAGVWMGVIGRHGNADVNDNGRLLLQLCCNNALCASWILSSNTKHTWWLVHRFFWSTVAHWFLHSFNWIVQFSVGRSCHKECNVRLEKQQGLSIAYRARRPYRMKWEALANTDVRNTVMFFIREFQECIADAEVEWQLFKAAVFSPAARECGRKPLGMVNNGTEVTPSYSRSLPTCQNTES